MIYKKHLKQNNGKDVRDINLVKKKVHRKHKVMLMLDRN